MQVRVSWALQSSAPLTPRTLWLGRQVMAMVLMRVLRFRWMMWPQGMTFSIMQAQVM